MALGAGGQTRPMRAHVYVLMIGLLIKYALAQPDPQLFLAPDPVFPSTYLSVRPQEGYTEYRIMFPSAYLSPYSANNRVYGWWLVPENRDGRVPAVVLLHSLGIRKPELEMGLAKELVRHGIGVLILTLPYHMKRAPAGKGSGDLLLQGDVAILYEAVVQAVWDTKRAIDWLQRRPEIDPERIGLIGISLGAILGSVVLGVEPRIHSAVLILGGVDLAHVLWNSVLGIRARWNLRAQGYTLTKLREALAPIEPMNLLSPALGAKTFVIGARFDIVVPTEDTEKLVKALGNPKVFWLDTGHFGGGLVQRPLFRMVRRYLSVRFAGQSPSPEEPPLLVPTLRIGTIYSTERDFRLALGVDLWRSDTRGTLFVSGILTPKGSSLFAGIRLRWGFSAGAEVTQRRTTGAVFWHFVL